MEFLFLALFIVIIYLLVTGKNELTEKVEGLENKIRNLQQLLMQQNLDKGKQTYESPQPAAPPVPKPVVVTEEKKPEPPVPEWKPTEVIWPAPIEQQPKPITDPFETIHRPVKTGPQRPPFAPRAAEPELSFFDRHPDLEKFIGENLINKIGIAILVLAIGFFVKYAIDNKWIGRVGRVGVGVLCGGILIGIAHRLRNSYRSFSSVLVGGGLAVLYFTITLAYHEFHLFSQTASFIILIVITCFAVALSLLYDKQELAVIALIGGLASPFMVSSDTPNYNALFLYLVILNTGLLVIAYNKSWRILNAVAFGLTIIVFAGVLTTLTDKTYVIGFVYATILYLLFFAINVANNVRESKTFIASDFSILLTNTALYFATGLYLLTAMHLEQARGLFSAGLALINLILSYILFKNKKVDTNILYLLIGITLTFISLTAPIQLHGQNITLFWAAETVLLYWLYQKSGISLMKLTSLIIWSAMIISLWMDWINVYSSSAVTFTIIANKGFITTVATAVSSYLLAMMIDKDDVEDIYGLQIKGGFYRYAAFVLLFMSGLLEINHQFLNHYPGTALNTLYLMLYVPAFVYVFYILSKKITPVMLDWRIGMAIISICVVVYLDFYSKLFEVEYSVLIDRSLSPAHFVAHLMGAIFIGLLFYQLIVLVRYKMNDSAQKTISWLLAGAIVLFLSFEVCLVTNLLFYSRGNTLDDLETVYIKVGLPILWGLSSFALMWLGMRYKFRTLRIISLTLFSITLFKLFVFDIQNIPPAGKIAAFFSLGVLLLIISFMYQKLKQIIVQDETPQQD